MLHVLFPSFSRIFCQSGPIQMFRIAFASDGLVTHWHPTEYSCMILCDMDQEGDAVVGIPKYCFSLFFL